MDEFDLLKSFSGVVECERDLAARDRLARMLHPGIYRHPETNEILRVRLNRHKTRVYSERWTQVESRWKFVYGPRAMDTLRAEHRMSLEEARAVSREAGQCLACAAILTDEKSQSVGIGPTCAKSWTYDQAVATLRGTILPPAREGVRARAAGDRIIITSHYDDASLGSSRPLRATLGTSAPSWRTRSRWSVSLTTTSSRSRWAGTSLRRTALPLDARETRIFHRGPWARHVLKYHAYGST
jgi:hypothetical protein